MYYKELPKSSEAMEYIKRRGLDQSIIKNLVLDLHQIIGILFIKDFLRMIESKNYSFEQALWQRVRKEMYMIIFEIESCFQLEISKAM